MTGHCGRMILGTGWRRRPSCAEVQMKDGKPRGRSLPLEVRVTIVEDLPAAIAALRYLAYDVPIARRVKGDTNDDASGEVQDGPVRQNEQGRPEEGHDRHTENAPRPMGGD